MADRFYINSPLEPGLVSFAGPEAHHLTTVCRLRPGDHVYLFNGDGQEYQAEVGTIARRCVTLEIKSAASPLRELTCRVLVAAPLPKGDRAQFLIEKLTELGAACYIPLRTQRSIVHPSDSRLEKLERYVIEASKQCGRNRLMSVEPPTDWPTLLDRTDLPAHKCLAHPGGAPLAGATGEDGVFAIGPEGGFTDEEVEQARSRGWALIGLGNRILRIETAAIALAAWAAQGR